MQGGITVLCRFQKIVDKLTRRRDTIPTLTKGSDMNTKTIDAAKDQNESASEFVGLIDLDGELMACYILKFEL